MKLHRIVMSNKKYIFIANWKMYLTGNQEVAFAEEYRALFIDLKEKSGHDIILCPSMINLRLVADLFKQTPIKIGAQDCSDYEKGAYTGQVPVAAIKDVGVDYCIVGHSERRLYAGETDEVVARKVLLLLDQQVTPIICIGEDRETYEAARTLEILEKQLALILKMQGERKALNVCIYIAYEPVWSIGTGKVSSPEALSVVFNWLYDHTKPFKNISWKFIYGGSVSESTVAGFSNLDYIDGFLVGGASLNFQAFKKIVSYY